ncbi:coiled-coil domain-containing protein 120 [Alosa pseudoharengus]|uniref:coiled-coil domain-containing protein 120 n=1 Tax=Alosa pseudoharengus TaxID=34774 RepID=UPI003F888D9D
MDDRGHVVSAMGLGAPDFQDGVLRTERVCELQGRKQMLQNVLSSRLGELRRVCLLEAELTGKLPRDFPLESGERPPLIQRRAHTHTQRSDDDPCQRRQMKTLFGGALCRSVEADKITLQGKRTVHRGCHTEETLKSESSSMSDSTSQDNESSPSVVPEQRSLSHPRLNPGSPDARITRKLSPVEIYYEMRTRRNSTSSSVSPSHSLPRSASNVEGRSVPATPLLSRTAPISIHVRPDVCGGIALKQWCGSPDLPHFVPLASLEGSASERRSCPHGSRARRSNSSEALLDRSSQPDPRMPPRGAGPYKSSEALTDGKLRQYRGSPERQAGGGGRTRASVGGRPSGAGYSEILLDYIWGKAPPRLAHMPAGPGPAPHWPEGCPPHFNGLSLSQQQLAAPPPYSPLLLHPTPPTHPSDPRRAKVTRTKSCGPFLAEPQLLSPYEPPPPPGRRPPPTPEDTTRSLHKALALEGLRHWYLRNALGYAPTKSHAHTPTQAPPTQGEALFPPLTIGSHRTHTHTHMTQSASFHGYPLQARAVELSRFPEPFPSQLQEGALADPPSDPPAPGTLV